VIRIAALHGVQLFLQPLISVLFIPDLMHDGGTIAHVQFADQLGDEMRMSGCFLDRQQSSAGGFALPRVLDLPVLGLAVHGTILAVFVLELLIQKQRHKIAQGIWAEAAALETFVLCDGGVVLQQLRDSAEGGLF
jgi:hypothetical protein